MRKTWLAIGAVVAMLAVLALVVVFSGDKGTDLRIGIFQIADHPALDKLREGFRTAIARDGWAEKRGVVLDFKNAAGDPARIESIASHFASSTCDLVYTIGTSCAQALKNKNPGLKLILAAATDPVAAKLIDSWEHPGGVITGTTDLPPVQRQLQVLLQLTPRARRIGVLYNTGEDNSFAAVLRLRAAAKAKGFELIEKPVTTPADIRPAVAALEGLVDVLYAPPDNTVQSGFEALVNGAFDIGVPVFDCDSDSVAKGALFSVGIDYHDIGVVSGEMALEVLKGADPAKMPIRSGKPYLYINTKTAERLGISVPTEVRSAAHTVIE